MGKNKQSGQMSFLFQTLKEQLNPRHPLYQLTGKIDWKSVEVDFQDITLILVVRPNRFG
jgi:hypothetical protein